MDAIQRNKELFYRFGLRDINDWLAYDLALVDSPNYGHGGYSEVGVMHLGDRVFYVKRQHDYRMRTLRHPFKGEPSFRRERYNIQRLDARGVQTLAVAYYQELQTPRGFEVVLVTEALDRYDSLDNIREQDYDDDSYLRLVQRVAKSVAKLHATGLRHPCLYPKHIFVSGDNIRFIDLETVRPHFSLRRFWLRDLDVILRRSSERFKDYREEFLHAYCDGDSKAADKLDRWLNKRKK
jgi:tRNA A-37 threonylcarbamoyl transferase component Bud32